MAARHHDRAVMLMQDLHFPPRAIGGGPATEESSPATAPPRNRPRSESRPARREDPMLLDGGVWPPITTPPERMP
jgi:hypothetical protein